MIYHFSFLYKTPKQFFLSSLSLLDNFCLHLLKIRLVENERVPLFMSERDWDGPLICETATYQWLTVWMVESGGNNINYKNFTICIYPLIRSSHLLLFGAKYIFVPRLHIKYWFRLRRTHSEIEIRNCNLAFLLSMREKRRHQN